MHKRKQRQQQVSVASFLAVWLLLASFGFDLTPAASLYESQIIGITFPSSEQQRLHSQQQQQLQLQLQLQQQQQQQQQQQAQQQAQQRYSLVASQLPSIYEQLRLAASSQPRTADTNVKRTILWKGHLDGQRAGGTYNQRPQLTNSELMATVALLENSTRGGKSYYHRPITNSQANSRWPKPRQAGLKFPRNSMGLDVANRLASVFDRQGNIINDYKILHQQDAMLYKQHQKKQQQQNRAGSEEVGPHAPILGPSSSNDNEWKRVESTRWNNLRGMWGKRADTTISGNSGSNGGASGVYDNVKPATTADELEDNRFKELLIELLEESTEQRATRDQLDSGAAADPIGSESKAD